MVEIRRLQIHKKKMEKKGKRKIQWREVCRSILCMEQEMSVKSDRQKKMNMSRLQKAREGIIKGKAGELGRRQTKYNPGGYLGVSP